jgi:alkylated DNA repair dioxygenase AlkB
VDGVVPLQRSLLTFGAPAVDAAAPWDRLDLGGGSWVDIARGFLHGADDLLEHVVTRVPWSCGRRRMYDRMVDDPRLSHRYRAPHDVPHSAFTIVREALAARYRVELGALALNYYRDGADSVAFHRDRELLELDDTLIAIVTLGARRPFLLRPLESGPVGRARSRDLAPGSGDLLVMGGACQQSWEHGVPKVASAGPRVSATWRWAVGRST